MQPTRRRPQPLRSPADWSEIEQGTYKNHFHCAPAAAALVPRHIPQPTAFGVQSATVVDLSDEPVETERDHRVKVRFAWQDASAGAAGENAGDFPENAPGTWVRVAAPWAGANWGASLVPRIGSEVAVEFVEGDMDRPVVVGALYNGADAPPFAAGVAMMQSVRNKADEMLAKVLGPTVEVLNRLARRLDIEADMHYRAATNSLNPHAFKRPELDAEKVAMRKKMPPWVDKGPRQKHPGLEEAPKKEGWFTLTDDQAKNCHTAAAVEYPPGSVLYRVVDPSSRDNSDCWMNPAEFAKLKSKDEWRRRFAVWGHWNRNGEYLTYTVPPGKPLRVWEGVTASQRIDPSKEFVLEGGARQILLNPADLNKAYTSKRQPTGWGYANHDGESVSMVGVPLLTNNWPE